MIRLITFLSAIVLLASCTVTERIHFNADFSGKYEMVLDMSAMKAFAEIPDSMGNVQSEPIIPREQLDSMKLEFENLQGISNLNINEENWIYTLSFHFTDPGALDGLNSELGLDGGDESKPGKPRFAWSKDKLDFTVDLESLQETSKDAEVEQGGEDTDMNSMFTLSTILSFDRPVESVKSDKATLDKATGEVVISYNLQEAMDSKSKSWNTSIKLGKGK